MVTRWRVGVLVGLTMLFLAVFLLWAQGNRLTTGVALVGKLSTDKDPGLKMGATDVLATAAELNRAADVSTRVVDVTASTLSATVASHDSKVVTLNRAAGIAVTLPAASGSGAVFRFVLGTTVTSNSTTIKVANASDVMTGTAVVLQDTVDTVVGFETASTTDTITWNGSTTGGIKGDCVELIDVAANLWYVRVIQSATGTEATPFSATV